MTMFSRGIHVCLHFHTCANTMSGPGRASSHQNNIGTYEPKMGAHM